MAGHAASQGRPDGSGHDAFGAQAPGYYSGGMSGAPGTAGPGLDPPAMATRHSATRSASDTKGFLGSLFDTGFTSFVTPKVIRVLYLLIIIGTILTGLSYSVIAFKVNAALGIVTLFVLAPLFTMIVLAMWRIVLEFFMVIFRISDDIHDMRQRGEFR
jgi:hypothetical protein